MCVVGSTMVDLVTRVPRIPAPGETLAGRSFTIGYGGKGGNQAVMAARLGADVTLVTRIGRDAFGDGALANYRAGELDRRHILRDEHASTGIASIFVDDVAQNCIAIVLGANDLLSVGDVHAAAAAIEAADILICQLEVPIATVAAAFEIARAANVTTILNPAPAAPVPADLWCLTDIAIPNETEVALLTGLPVETDAEAARAGQVLLQSGARVVIVTLGRRGSLVVTPDLVERIVAPDVSAVDTTGAGDAFVGTLAVCRAAGLSMIDAARRASLIAALSVTREGTQTSFPNLSEATRFVQSHGLTMPLPGTRKNQTA